MGRSLEAVTVKRIYLFIESARVEAIYTGNGRTISRGVHSQPIVQRCLEGKVLCCVAGAQDCSELKEILLDLRQLFGT